MSIADIFHWLLLQLDESDTYSYQFYQLLK